MERRRKLIPTCLLDGTHSFFAERVAHTVKKSVCAALFVTVCFYGHISYADQFNDLYYIDPGGVPDLTEEGARNENVGGGNTGGNTNGNTGGSAGGATNTGGASSGAPTNGNFGNVSGGVATTGGGETSDSGGSGVHTEEEAIVSLMTEGAILGGTEMLSGALNADSIVSSGGSVIVNGSRVRAFVRKDPDIDEILRYWKIGKGKQHPEGKTTKDRLTPGEYYTLIAATLAANDEALEETRFTAQDFEVLYRSRGALFAFIPFTFPVRVSVRPYISRERVTVHFPWYHWFVREYFTRASLAKETDGAIQSVISGAKEGEDIHGELLETVVAFLRQKVRTITDSIILQ